jgi:uncharacterized protein
MRFFIPLLIAASAAIAQSLPVIPLTAGMHRIQAELALEPGARMRGLMFRESMPANAGMLFIFDELQTHCMWMKNTLIPLSVAFLDEKGAIINIADMAPKTEDSHCAAKPARYALEMNKGWFAARGIKPGAAIGGLEKLGR